MASANTPYGPVDSDVSPALLPLAAQQAVNVSSTITSPNTARGTSLPASPNDGDEYVYTADSGNGIEWRLKYNAGSSSTYKWECIGGPLMTASIAADESTATAAAWADLATAGPKVIVPRAGDYEVYAECLLYSTSASAMSIGIASGTGTPADPLISRGEGAVAVTANVGVPISIVGQTLTGVSASADIRIRYNYSVATGHAIKRTIAVRPVRVI